MIEALREAVLKGDLGVARAMTSQALADGVSPAKILDDTLIAAMEIVGEEFETGERFIPEMLVSAEAMKAAMSVLRPELAATGVPSRGKIVIGTVEGDLHDIGKDLVATMLEGAGFEVVDLGVEATAQQFVDAVKENAPDVVGMSALLTTTMVFMPEVVRALEEAGVRSQVKIVVGGAPVTAEFAREIAADGYADDAASAVTLVKSLISGPRT